MDITLTNKASALGNYGLIPTTIISEVVATQLVSGLTILKRADKEVWADGGFLTYTITITNTAGQKFSNVKMTDLLDPLIISLVDDSVTVDGNTATYTIVAGLLTVDIPDLEVGESAEIIFQVQKI